MFMHSRRKGLFRADYQYADQIWIIGCGEPIVCENVIRGPKSSGGICMCSQQVEYLSNAVSLSNFS